MKSARRAWLLLVLIACVAVAPMLMAPPRALAVGPAAPEVVAQGVAILDEAGNLVYGKNPHKRYAMASLTKTMTAVVALENSDIKKRVLVDVSWDEIPDSSIMGLSLMEEVTIEEMLYGLMLPSGNDAARAIARAISGDEYRFAELMNAKAKELGMLNTQYKNPHGMDEDGHYTSAYDLAVLGRYAMRNPTFRQIVATKNITVHGKGIYPLRNINHVLYNYEGADGIKTGFTDNARAGVLASAVRAGKRVYVSLLRTWNYATEAAQMMDYYFGNVDSLSPIPGGPTLDTLPIPKAP
ncbi:MAG: D-alanyl-D-alanine carboxypeptidase family protein [Chloroflexota bacterium]